VTDHIVGLIDNAGGLGSFLKLGGPPPSEEEEFARVWPRVAARIGIKIEPEPAGLLDPGVTYYPKVSQGVSFGPDFWRAMVKRHTHNADAVRENGMVKSRLTLDDADQTRWALAQRSASYQIAQLTRHVDAVTAIGPRGNITVLTINGTYP
jgi:hypothetical protein